MRRLLTAPALLPVPALLLVPVLLLASACGCDDRHTRSSFTVTSYGTGASRVWMFEPRDEPRAAVVFVHGAGDERETTPYYHRPWLEHLAQTGVTVVYPRYELYPGQPAA